MRYKGSERPKNLVAKQSCFLCLGLKQNLIADRDWMIIQIGRDQIVKCSVKEAALGTELRRSGH